MKKKIIIIISILIALALIITLPLVLLQEEKQAKVQPFGVWWWNDRLDDSYLDFAQQQGVTEIYYCSSKFNNQTESFIDKANKKGIQVFWLAGEYQWIFNYDKVKNKIEEYNSYQQSYKSVFKGIHFDIEPHQHPEFHSKRNEIISKFVELCYQIKTDYPSLYVEYDIPFWLNDEIIIKGQTKPAYQAVIDCASRVTVMSYRDTSQAIYDVAKDEMEYAVKQGKTINFGVETKSSEGDNVSFMEEGKNAMMREIERLRKLILPSCGVVVHQIYTWYNLQD